MGRGVIDLFTKEEFLNFFSYFFSLIFMLKLGSGSVNPHICANSDPGINTVFIVFIKFYEMDIVDILTNICL